MIVKWESEAEQKLWESELDSDPIVSVVWDGLYRVLCRVKFERLASDVGSSQMMSSWEPYSTQTGTCTIMLEMHCRYDPSGKIVLYIRSVKAEKYY